MINPNIRIIRVPYTTVDLCFEIDETGCVTATCGINEFHLSPSFKSDKHYIDQLFPNGYTKLVDPSPEIGVASTQ